MYRINIKPQSVTTYRIHVANTAIFLLLLEITIIKELVNIISLSQSNTLNGLHYFHSKIENVLRDAVHRFQESVIYTRWFKYDRDWLVCKQAALRSSCATLREWSHNLNPPSCSG